MSDSIAQRLTFALFLVVLAPRCQCRLAPLDGVEPAWLSANPSKLRFPPTYVGHSTSLMLEVRNEGEEGAEVEVSVPSPFGTDGARVRTGRREVAPLEVWFAPQSPGRFAATLALGELEIELEGEGLEVPECLPRACEDVHFDVATGACASARKPEGTACATPCVSDGQCVEGECLGTSVGCSDQNACTVDFCDNASGCGHAPLVCPAPQSACQVAVCDSVSGCGLEDAPDGTLCGPDDCLNPTVDVCIQGQCQQRTRPAQGQCTNTWTPAYVPLRSEQGMVYDATRGRMLLFGGDALGFFFSATLSDTWEREGTTWVRRRPASAPSGRAGHMMVYDSHRQRVVLFGGDQNEGDTWEWDGITWVERKPATSPPGLRGTALAYDVARRRTVLFGGVGPHPDYIRAGTWEWDGVTWVERSPVTSPPLFVHHSMAWDGTRQRIVLFGGGADMAVRAETWEWDGTTWTQRTPTTSPPARMNAAMTWDEVRGRVVLFGGHNGSHPSFSDTWEWDGTNWHPGPASPSPGPRSGHSLAYDPHRARTVLFGGSYSPDDAWEWDGFTWTRSPRPDDPARGQTAMAWDSARQVGVMFGGWNGVVSFADTWEWNGALWTPRTPATSPPARRFHALAYDAGRARTVLFGGKGLNDTWEWDGSDWVQRFPQTSPPSSNEPPVLAYDEVRKRTVMVRDGQTWEWDGTGWVDRTPAASPPFRAHPAMAWDPIRKRTVLFGGLYFKPLSDTWEWDGTTWTERLPSSAPVGMDNVTMAFDSARGRLLLFGESGAQPATWEWDGTDWTKRQPWTSAPTTYGQALVYDPVKARFVLFGSAGTWLFLP